MAGFAATRNFLTAEWHSFQPFCLALAQTAERTRELAANTVAELGKQGQKLDTINRDLNEVSAGCVTWSCCK